MRPLDATFISPQIAINFICLTRLSYMRNLVYDLFNEIFSGAMYNIIAVWYVVSIEINIKA